MSPIDSAVQVFYYEGTQRRKINISQPLMHAIFEKQTGLKIHLVHRGLTIFQFHEEFVTIPILRILTIRANCHLN